MKKQNEISVLENIRKASWKNVIHISVAKLVEDIKNRGSIDDWDAYFYTT